MCKKYNQLRRVFKPKSVYKNDSKACTNSQLSIYYLWLGSNTSHFKLYKMYQKKWYFSKFHKTRKYAPIWHPKQKHLFFGGFFETNFYLGTKFFIRCHFKYKFLTLVVFLIALAYRVKGNDSR